MLCPLTKDGAVNVAMVDASESHAESEYLKEIKEAKIKKYLSIERQLQRTHRPQPYLLHMRPGHTSQITGAAVWQRWPVGYSRHSPAAGWPRRGRRSVRGACVHYRDLVRGRFS